MVTSLLVTVNVAVFVRMVISGVPALWPKPEDLLPWGSNYGPLSLSGEWWRMVSAIFLHFGVVHLLLNMLALWSVAAIIESLQGGVAMFALFMLSGIAASTTSLMWHPQAVGAGASGAIFGLYGALVVFAIRDRQVLPREKRLPLAVTGLACVVSDLVIGQRIAVVDNAAHLGGLAAGVLGALILSPPEERTDLFRFVGPLFLGVVSVGLLLATPAVLPHPANFPGELRRFSEFDARIESSYNADLDGLRSKQLGARQFTEVVKRDILTPWIAERQRLAAITGFSKNQQPRIAEVLAYMELREQGWSMLLDGLRRSDPRATRQSSQLMEKANADIKALATAISRRAIE